jgi:glycosyltransferase involved in cell wall biosynthesis
MRDRVLILAHQYLPSDPRIRRELDALADAGVAADVVCLRRPGQPRRGEYRSHRLYRLPVRRHRGAGLATYLAEYAAFWILAFFTAARLHLRNRYRTVATHTLPDPLVFAALVPRLLGARVVIDMHEYTPELFQTRHGLQPDHWLIRLVTRLEAASCRFADVVVTVHEPGAALLESRGVSRSKMAIIPNTAPDSGGGERVAASRGPFTLVYHGLLANQYDLRTALGAMARLESRGVPARLRIVGEGPDEPALRALAGELGLGAARVAFEPQVSPESIPAVLAAADAGLVPMKDVVYTHLTLPMKLLECAAEGLPAITTPSRTIRHYFPEGTVLYVPFSDPDALADAIERLASDRSLRDSLRRGARKAIQPLRWEVVGREYAELLAS